MVLNWLNMKQAHTVLNSVSHQSNQAKWQQQNDNVERFENRKSSIKLNRPKILQCSFVSMNVMQTAKNTRKEFLSWNFGFILDWNEWMDEYKKDHMKKNKNKTKYKFKWMKKAIANIFNEILIPFNDALTRNFIAV